MVKTRIVGIDYGLKRIGIALSDETKLIATPLMMIGAKRKTEETVDHLLQKLEAHQKEFRYTIEAIVVGNPIQMSGKVGFLADEVSHFVEALKQKTSIPIILWDERLTSVQAERALREGPLTRKKRTKLVDKVSAAILLQSYLDNQKGVRTIF